MEKGTKDTMTTRMVSVCFIVLALAVFKPFGLDAWHWQAYVHLMAIWVIGILVCMLTDAILKYVVRMPRSYGKGVGYIFRRNLWFQLINTPIVSLVVCLYRHFVLSDRVDGNRLSWTNFLETLLIFAFCSFAIGMYWRFKFRSRFLAAELEETRLLNEQLQKRQLEMEQQEKEFEAVRPVSATRDAPEAKAVGLPLTSIVLTGTTSETISLQIADLLYIEAVGNYLKVYYLRDGKVRSDMLRATSKQMEGDLKGFPMVVRCHRAFLVNLQQVERIVSKAGVMQLVIKHCHETLPVSRSNMSQVREAINGGVAGNLLRP